MSVLYYMHLYKLYHYMPFIAKCQVDFPCKAPPTLFEYGDIKKFNFGNIEISGMFAL
jgi:hypothetical protein